MKVESSPLYIPALFKDRVTGKWEQKDINWTELMENAEATRKAKAQQLASSKKTLSSEEIDALAEKLYQKYDPRHMSQNEYNCFIDDLVNSGVMNRAETEFMGGRLGITVDPTAPGGLVKVRPGERLAWSLAEANGDAKVFLNTLKQWYNSGTQADEARSNAIRKATAVLDAIIQRRERSGL